MSNLPVTVLMSVYNGERWLDESIPSVLNQTFEDFEFLIVNDGSTDRSLEIIHRYAEYDSRVRVLDKQNSGLTDSLNHGITQAKGQWIARIDADDLCLPERLEKQYALAQSDPSIILIGTGLQQIDENGRQVMVRRIPEKHDQLLRRLTSYGPFFSHSSAFYRADVVKVIGGYRTRLRRCQDRDLWLRLSEVGKLAGIDLLLVRVRCHEHQISRQEGGKRQKIYSHVAMVSYWLRQSNFKDPVGENSSEEEFITFINWITECLMHEQIFEHYSHLEDVKKDINEVKSNFSKFHVLLSAFLRNPSFFIHHLRQRILGERLTRKLAKAWMRRV